jgi:outer membrane murein-binding lipoprotein Lpp
MDFAGLVALAIGVMGVAGVVFTALKYNRDDTTAIVTQQSTIVKDMQALNDELRTQIDRLRQENDQLRSTVDRLSQKVPDA